MKDDYGWLSLFKNIFKLFWVIAACGLLYQCVSENARQNNIKERDYEY